MNERRRHIRFDVILTALIDYKNKQGKSLQAKAETRDISCNGAYLVIDSPLPVGARIDFRIYLPNYKVFNGRSKSFLSGSAQVVRSEDKGVGINFYSTEIKPLPGV